MHIISYHTTVVTSALVMEAMRSIIALVPALKGGCSKQPMGPFQMTV